MDADEREIYYYLKSWQREFLSSREICRRAGGKKRFQAEPDWAKPVLLRMVEKGILETDASGYYRIKPIHKKDKGTKWVSPHIAKILQESGKDFSGTINVDNMDEYYDKL
jgi:hypothetical protein